MLVFPFLTLLLGVWQIQEVRVIAAEAEAETILPPEPHCPPIISVVAADVWPRSVCANAGGYCFSFLGIPGWCDHIRPGLCGDSYPHCLCCIDCSKRQEYSDCAKAGGTCRKNCKCLSNEYEDVHRCPASGCTCCLGKCKDDICSRVGGYCAALEVKCMPNYARFRCGCGDCACCVPYEKQADALQSLKCAVEK